MTSSKSFEDVIPGRPGLESIVSGSNTGITYRAYSCRGNASRLCDRQVSSHHNSRDYSADFGREKVFSSAEEFYRPASFRRPSKKDYFTNYVNGSRVLGANFKLRRSFGHRAVFGARTRKLKIKLNVAGKLVHANYVLLREPACTASFNQRCATSQAKI